MKSLEQLEAIRAKAKEAMAIREGGKAITVSVAMGTCGIAAGARQVLSALVDELTKRGRNDVMVTQTGCAGFCEKEPIIKVIGPGNSKVVYSYVNDRRAREIVALHIVNGQVLSDYVLEVVKPKEA